MVLHGNLYSSSGYSNKCIRCQVTIQNGHTATVTSSVSIDQVVVNSTGILSINAGQTLSIADGIGTDLVVSGQLTISGTITPTGTIVFNASLKLQSHTERRTFSDLEFVASNCNVTGITEAATAIID